MQRVVENWQAESRCSQSANRQYFHHCTVRLQIEVWKGAVSDFGITALRRTVDRNRQSFWKISGEETELVSFIESTNSLNFAFILTLIVNGFPNNVSFEVNLERKWNAGHNHSYNQCIPRRRATQLQRYDAMSTVIWVQNWRPIENDAYLGF